MKNILPKISLSSVKIPLLLSLLNQIVHSGGNFIVGVYLARTLSLADFGLYGMGFGVCMLYIGVGNALVLTQMVVNNPDKTDTDKEAYAAKMLLAVLMLGSITLLLTAVITGGVIALVPDWYRFSDTVLSIAVASVCFLFKEYFISYAFMRRREKLALVINVLSVAVLCGGLLIEYLAGMALTAENVLLLYAAGAAAGALVGYVASPLKINRGTGNMMPELVEAWSHGRWALGGVTVTWIQAQTYTYSLAFFLGPAGVGQANAARIFISPFSFLLPAINKITIPRLAEYRQTDRAKMLRISCLVTGGLFMFAILYSILLLSSLDFVTKVVLGRNDQNIQALVWIWCCVLAVQMLLTGGSGLLQVMKKFRILTLINIPSAIVTVASAIVLIKLFGASGAIWGMAAGELVLCILVWKEIRNERNNGG